MILEKIPSLVSVLPNGCYPQERKKGGKMLQKLLVSPTASGGKKYVVWAAFIKLLAVESSRL